MSQIVSKLAPLIILVLVQLLKHCFCTLSGLFDLRSECLKIIISLVLGESLKPFKKSWIGSFFSCQFKVRGQAFMGLNNHSLFQGRGKLLALNFCVVLVLE